MAAEGAPSSNSSVPRRLSTRSGVEIERSVPADTPFFFVFLFLAVLIPSSLPLENVAPPSMRRPYAPTEPDRIIRSR